MPVDHDSLASASNPAGNVKPETSGFTLLTRTPTLDLRRAPKDAALFRKHLRCAICYDFMLGAHRFPPTMFCEHCRGMVRR